MTTKFKKFGVLLALVMIVVLSMSVLFAACDKNDTKAKGDFTVTFVNGDSSTSTDVAKDAVVKQPADPSKTGYVFSGWYLDNAQYDFNSPVTSDITLVAKFTAKTYTARVDANGGNLASGVNQNVLLTYDQPYSLGTASKGGYLFLGFTYNDELVTDSNGASLAPWAFDVSTDITFTAAYALDEDNIGDLSETIAQMMADYNFTANYSTDNHVYQTVRVDDRFFELTDIADSNRRIGFKIAGPPTSLKVYSVDYTKSPAVVSDQPYTVNDVEFTVAQLRETYCILPVIVATKFYRSTDSDFYAKDEYVKELATALFGTFYGNGAQSLLVKITGGSSKQLLSISLNGGDVAIAFSKIGETDVDFSTYTQPYVSQLPPTHIDGMPEAPKTYGDAEMNGVDAFDATQYPNYNGDSALQQAINKAREEVHINIVDHFVCGACGPSTSSDSDDYRDYSKYYVLDFRGLERHGSRAGDATFSTTSTNFFYVETGGELKRAKLNDGTLELVDPTVRSTYNYEQMAIDGNPFWHLTDSMFTATGVEGEYVATASMIDEVGAILFANMQNPKDNDMVSSHFSREYPSGFTAPSYEVKNVKLTLDEDGNIATISAERSFTVVSNSSGSSYTDNTFTISYTCSDTVTAEWPYETVGGLAPSEPTLDADQEKLKTAVENMGYNYTLTYYTPGGSTCLIWYYANDVIYEGYYAVNSLGDLADPTDKYGTAGGSSGYYFINDYAYSFDIDENGILDFYDLTEPTEWGGQKYYRAYMYAKILPLMRIAAADFAYSSSLTYDGSTGVYTLTNTDRWDYYTDYYMFGRWWDDESDGELTSSSFKIFLTLTADGTHIDKIVVGTLTNSEITPAVEITVSNVGATRFEV